MGERWKTVEDGCGLLADDTTNVGMSDEIDDGVKLVKSFMKEWEKRNNDVGEDMLEIGKGREEKKLYWRVR